MHISSITRGCADQRDSDIVFVSSVMPRFKRSVDISVLCFLTLSTFSSDILSALSGSCIYFAMSRFLKCASHSFINCLTSLPEFIAESSSSSADDISAFMTRSVSSIMTSSPAVPSISATSSRVMRLSPVEMHCSSILRLSRTEPSAFTAMSASAASSASSPRASHIILILSAMVFSDTRLKSSRMQRESIVAGSFCGSVVASMKTTFSGGSSRVLSSALNAPVDSMCTSSMIYTLLRPTAGGYLTLSLSSRMLSTPLFDAASISMTSIKLPSFMARQLAHSQHGLAATSSDSQLSALASIRAVVVFPVPRVPQNRYACPVRPDAIWLFNIRTI